MDVEPGVAAAAELFKILGSESRLTLLRCIRTAPSTVGTIADATGMSQPLVSQHLRTLRQAGLVAGTRSGKEMTYRLSDDHVAHVIDDAIAHTQEPRTAASAHPPQTTTEHHRTKDTP